jgi:YVTN family beta-propeller protein
VGINAATGRVTGVVRVGGAPVTVAAYGGLVWVADGREATVHVIDQRTNQVQTTIPLSGPVSAGLGGPAIASQGQSAWVVTNAANSVSRVDADTRVPLRTSLHARPSSVAVGGDVALVAERAAGTVDVVDMLRSTARQLKVGGAPSGVALKPDGSTGWVVDRASRDVVQVDTRTVRITRRTPLPVVPDQATRSSDGALWVTSSSRNEVLRIDPRAPGAKPKVIPVGSGPTGITFGKGRVWVADSKDTTVSSIDPDPDNGYGVATLQLGFHPAAIAVDDQTGNVWVTVTA